MKYPVQSFLGPAISMENTEAVFHKGVRVSSDPVKFWEKFSLVNLNQGVGLSVQDDPWLQVAPSHQR